MQRPAHGGIGRVDRIGVVGKQAILSSHIEDAAPEFPQARASPTTRTVSVCSDDAAHRAINDELMLRSAAGHHHQILADRRDQSCALIKVHPGRATQWEATARTSGRGCETRTNYRSWLNRQQRRTLRGATVATSRHVKLGGGSHEENSGLLRTNKVFFPRRGADISFRQIVIPRRHGESKARASSRRPILVELRKGGDFAAAARRFSMDPGTKEQGGSLGWMRRGQNLDQNFEDAAFALRPGIISDPVETAFGYHLIQVERAQPAEVQIRHILIMPVLEQSDADSAARIGANLHDALEKGTSFDSLQRAWHDKAEERELANFPFDSLPAPIARR